MSGKIISNIVFTRNRPLQLASYLLGLYKQLPKELIQTYIIYKRDLFDSEYQPLFKKYPGCIVVYEDNFHDDFVELINKISTNYILFGTDDVVFFDSMDFNIIDQTFKQHSQDIFGFMFRLSLQYVQAGGDDVQQVNVTGQTVYKVNWKKARRIISNIRLNWIRQFTKPI